MLAGSTTVQPTETKKSASAPSSTMPSHHRVANKVSTTMKWIHATSLPAPLGPHRGNGSELLPHLHASSHQSAIAQPSHGHTSQIPTTGGGAVVDTSTQIGVGPDSNAPVAGVPSSGVSIRNNSFPVSVPMSHTVLPNAFIQREQEIFCHSDSEDEAIEYVYPKKIKLPQDSVKTDTWRDSMVSKYCVNL